MDSAFEILQPQFAIVHGPTMFGNQEIHFYIMTPTTILKNMITENERDKDWVTPSNSREKWCIQLEGKTTSDTFF